MLSIFSSTTSSSVEAVGDAETGLSVVDSGVGWTETEAPTTGAVDGLNVGTDDDRDVGGTGKLRGSPPEKSAAFCSEFLFCALRRRPKNAPKIMIMQAVTRRQAHFHPHAKRRFFFPFFFLESLMLSS